MPSEPADSCQGSAHNTQEGPHEWRAILSRHCKGIGSIRDTEHAWCFSSTVTIVRQNKTLIDPQARQPTGGFTSSLNKSLESEEVDYDAGDVK